MKEFAAFLKDFKSVSAILGKAALLAPFLTLVVNIGPPWPEKARVPITALFQLFALMYAFEFWHPRGKARLKKTLRWSFAIFGVAFVLYIALFTSFTYPAPSYEHREAKGLIKQPAVAEILTPTYTIDDAVAGSGYDPFLVWEPWTVYLMRIVLLSSWLILFVSI